jgi:hypothetical protein
MPVTRICRLDRDDVDADAAASDDFRRNRLRLDDVPALSYVIAVIVVSPLLRAALAAQTWVVFEYRTFSAEARAEVPTFGGKAYAAGGLKESSHRRRCGFDSGAGHSFLDSQREILSALSADAADG